MKVSLRKTQRLIFETAKKHEGSFFRTYKKSSTSNTVYYRLMSKDFSPIKNFTRGNMKPLFTLGVLENIEAGVFRIKTGVEVIEKKRKTA